MAALMSLRSRAALRAFNVNAVPHVLNGSNESVRRAGSSLATSSAGFVQPSSHDR